MIKPSIGRVVWYYPRGTQQRDNPDEQPNAALVVYVHNDRLVNLAGFDANGRHSQATSVRLIQEGDDAGEYGPYAPFCSWMPFQLGQAKAAESVGKAA